MVDPSLDDVEHLTPSFREAFSTWSSFRSYLNDHAAYPEYDVRRAAQQVLMADLSARLPGVTDGKWLLLGSVSLPARVDPGWQWPAGYPDRSPITPGQVMARPAFDLDLCYREPPGSGTASYGEVAQAAVHAIAPPDHELRGGFGRLGLGGLVRYSSDLRLVAEGRQVMGIVRAQPVGRDGQRPVDDPITIEIDIKPPTKVVFDGPPEQARQSFVGINVPGLAVPQMPMYPTENAFADKAALLTGPPTSLRGPVADSWHRYKDLLDLYYLTQTVPLNSDRLSTALADNWNFTRMERGGLPNPYRVYGDATRTGDEFARSEPPIDWTQGVDQLRTAAPQLAIYPDFEAMSTEVGRCIDGVTTTPTGSMWTPGRGWSIPEHATPTPDGPQQEAARHIADAREMLSRAPHQPARSTEQTELPPHLQPPGSGRPPNPDIER